LFTLAPFSQRNTPFLSNRCLLQSGVPKIDLFYPSEEIWFNSGNHDEVLLPHGDKMVMPGFIA
jgi:hypothetical protein